MGITVSTLFNIDTCNDISNNILVYVNNLKKLYYESVTDSQLLIKIDKTFVCPEKKQTLHMSTRSPR